MKLLFVLSLTMRLNIIPPDFYTNLLNTLSFAHLSLDDLKFERKTYKEDSFGVHLIDTAIIDPLHLLERSEEILINLKDTLSLDSLYIVLSGMLDFKTPKRKFFRGSFLNRLAHSIIMADSVLKCAFSNLNLAQIDSLLFETTYLFADTDDSTMVKKRGLLRIISDTVDSVPLDRYLKLIEKVKRERIYLAGYRIVSELENVIPEILGSKLQPGYYNVDGVNVYIGTSGNDTFDAKVPYVVIEPDGNDVYYISTGEVFKSGIIIDLSGNDRYNGSDISIGGAVFSNSVVIDLSGDDYYEGGIISLGADMFGCGVLYDGEGENVFKGAYFSQGAGFCGIGILYSGGEDDYYTIWDFGQGFGGLWGIGIFMDLDGEDVYMDKYRKNGIRTFEYSGVFYDKP